MNSSIPNEEKHSVIPGAGTPFVIGAGFAGIGLGGRYLKSNAKGFYENSDFIKKHTDNYLNKHNLKFDDILTKRAGGMKFGEDIKNTVKMYGGIKKTPNKFEKNFTTRPKLYKAPIASAFGIMSMKMELDGRNNLSAVPIAMANEGLATAGGLIGGQIGKGLMKGLAGSFIGSGSVGFFAGAGIGAMTGYMAISALEEISNIGRKWSTPDTGGNFVDSKNGQTMRARSLNAIRTSQFNVRSNLGNEAIRLAGL